MGKRHNLHGAEHVSGWGYLGVLSALREFMCGNCHPSPVTQRPFLDMDRGLCLQSGFVSEENLSQKCLSLILPAPSQPQVLCSLPEDPKLVPGCQEGRMTKHYKPTEIFSHPLMQAGKVKEEILEAKSCLQRKMPGFSHLPEHQPGAVHLQRAEQRPGWEPGALERTNPAHPEAQLPFHSSHTGGKQSLWASSELHTHWGDSQGTEERFVIEFLFILGQGWGRCTMRRLSDDSH